jgi:hypothetical protein
VIEESVVQIEDVAPLPEALGVLGLGIEHIGLIA